MAKFFSPLRIRKKQHFDRFIHAFNESNDRSVTKTYFDRRFYNRESKRDSSFPIISREKLEKILEKHAVNNEIGNKGKKNREFHFLFSFSAKSIFPFAIEDI